MSQTAWTIWLGRGISTCPMLLVCMIGLFVSFKNLKRCPKPAQKALVAFLLIGASEILSPIISIVLTQLVTRSSGAMSPMIFGGSACMTNILFAGGIGLLLSAVFTDRQGESVEEK